MYQEYPGPRNRRIKDNDDEETINLKLEVSDNVRSRNSKWLSENNSTEDHSNQVILDMEICQCLATQEKQSH